MIEKLINPAAAYVRQTTINEITEVYREASTKGIPYISNLDNNALNQLTKPWSSPGESIGESIFDISKGNITLQTFAVTVVEQGIKGISAFIPGGTLISVGASLFLQFLKK